MKRILTFVIATIICGNLFSQNFASYAFRKPVSNGSNSWKFVSVISGVDAIVTVIGSKNASLDKIDDSTVYKNAWQPFIKISNATSQNTDSSYLIFKIDFQKTNGTPASQNALAMTVIDLDGSSSLREFVRASLPATNMNITNSSINSWMDLRWLNVISGTTTFANIDTSNYRAMTQINYSTVKSFTLRVGVVGTIAAGTVRQHSFYFKPFSVMTVALPVNLINFDAEAGNTNAEVKWTTASEENLSRFEVCRSADGRNFIPVGTVEARVNSNEAISYSFTDNTMSSVNAPVVYYKLKMIGNDGQVEWSNTVSVKQNNAPKASISVYPNPSTSYVNVTLDTEVEAGQISIMNSNGQKVASELNMEINNNNVRMDVRALENGIYFVQISNNDGTTTSVKFIKR